MSVKRILIYRLGSLGDTVIALPCFHKIRETFPNADITLLTNRPVAAKAAPIEAILGKGYFYDRVLDYPIGTRNPFTLEKLIRQIRSLNIELVINLTAARSKLSTYRDLYFFRTAGVKNQIGHPTLVDDFNPPVEPSTDKQQWEAKRLANRINKLGDIDLYDDKYWDLKLTSVELKQAELLLANLHNNSTIIAISVGTKLQVNNWGVENWINLLIRLRISFPHSELLIIGSAEESTTAEACLKSWGGQGMNLCGKTSPRVSAAILKQSSIFIGHDSGPMHLAACVGVPCVAIFSARNFPGRWYPRGISNQIIYHKTDCAGCGLETCIEQKKKCILSITVDEVHQAVLQTFDYTKQDSIV